MVCMLRYYYSSFLDEEREEDEDAELMDSSFVEWWGDLEYYMLDCEDEKKSHETSPHKKKTTLWSRLLRWKM